MAQDIKRHIDAAKVVIQRAMEKSKKQVLAYSGGKDSIVVCHIARSLGIKAAVCETSFYFERQLDNVKDIARILDLDVHWMCSLDVNWLRKHPQVLFSNDSKIRGWSFAERQQKTVKRFAKQYNFDCQIFGRRTEENSVKDVLYTTTAGLQCHPIRTWNTEMVWQYLKEHNLPVPWIYSTRIAEHGGNGPFYSMQKRNYGGEENCWQIVSALDPRYTKQNMFG